MFQAHAQKRDQTFYWCFEIEKIVRFYGKFFCYLGVSEESVSIGKSPK